jgi:hypothetical protein
MIASETQLQAQWDREFRAIGITSMRCHYSAFRLR